MNKEIPKQNAGILNEKKLLDELAIDISRKFGLDKKRAIELLKTDTTKGLSKLKEEIDKQETNELKKIGNKKLEELFFILKGAQELIEKSSKIEIKMLKDDIEKNINIEEFKNHIEEYLPKKLLQKAKNPQKIHEHVLGLALGTTNSIFKTVEILYQIGKGILKTPIDLYMIVSGKGKSESFKDV